MIRLEARNVGLERDGRPVLMGISLELSGGELVCVIGANGAGKSTLLAGLAGLIAPVAGTVDLDGRPLARIGRRDLARRRAYLPQTPRCDWPLPVERMVALGLTPSLPPFGGLPEAMQAEVARALAECDVAHLKDRPANALSGGELARAMLARALVGRPDLLIVDEPTAGLDPRHALEAMSRLKSVAASGRAVVAAVHDLSLVARFADRVVALAEGGVLADGPTRKVLTAELLLKLFEVEARVAFDGRGLAVTVVGPAP